MPLHAGAARSGTECRERLAGPSRGTGFRNTPKPGPEMKPVIPPWNYEKMVRAPPSGCRIRGGVSRAVRRGAEPGCAQATAYEEKKLVAKHDILAAAQKGVSVDALRNRR